MPLDPRIPLSAVGIQVQDPQEVLAQQAQLRTTQLQQQAVQGQLADQQRARENLVKLQQRQALIDNAISEATVLDPDTGMPRIEPSKLVGHLPAHLLPEVMKRYYDDIESGNKVLSSTLDLADKRQKHLVGAAHTIAASNYDPQTFRIEIRAAQKMHAISKEMAEELLAIDDPEQIKSMVDGVIQQSLPPRTPVPVQTTNEQGQNVTQFVDPKAGTTYPNQPPKEELVPVQTMEGGRPVTKFVKKSEGGTYPSPPPQRDERIVQVIGDDGNPIWVRESAAVGKRAVTPGQTRPLTAEERKNAGFYRQMQQAISNINALESKLTEADIYQIQSLPQEGFMGAVNRSTMSDNAKKYIQAFNQFTEARLRSVSGAAINASEYARDRETYARQYGETDDLSQQRKSSRGAAVESLRFMAGNAVPEDEPTDQGGAQGGASGGWSYADYKRTHPGQK